MLFSLLLGACTEPDRPTISLYRAVNAGDIDQLERHIYWNADLNKALPGGETPLHAAARLGRIFMTRLLLKHGADIEVTNSAAQTPIYVALASGRTQVAELLLKNGAQLDADRMLHEVAGRGIADRDVVSFLIAHGGNVNNADESGNTPLHTAVGSGYRVVAKFLIAQGADVNAVNKNLQAPLNLAMEKNNPDLINLLKRNGAVLQ